MVSGRVDSIAKTELKEALTEVELQKKRLNNIFGIVFFLLLVFIVILGSEAIQNKINPETLSFSVNETFSSSTTLFTVSL